MSAMTTSHPPSAVATMASLPIGLGGHSSSVLSFGRTAKHAPPTTTGLGKATLATTTETPTMNNRDSSDGDENNGEFPDDTPLEQRIYYPRRCDVLLGRGKPFQSHFGNVRLHKFVNHNRERYLGAARDEKNMIAKTIVRGIKLGTGGEPPGRFLKRAGEGRDFWVECTDVVARQKVGHALRGKPRRGELSPRKGDVSPQAAIICDDDPRALGGPQGRGILPSLGPALEPTKVAQPPSPPPPPAEPPVSQQQQQQQQKVMPPVVPAPSASASAPSASASAPSSLASGPKSETRTYLAPPTKPTQPTIVSVDAYPGPSASASAPSSLASGPKSETRTYLAPPTKLTQPSIVSVDAYPGPAVSYHQRFQLRALSHPGHLAGPHGRRTLPPTSPFATAHAHLLAGPVHASFLPHHPAHSRLAASPAPTAIHMSALPHHHLHHHHHPPLLHHPPPHPHHYHHHPQQQVPQELHNEQHLKEEVAYARQKQIEKAAYAEKIENRLREDFSVALELIKMSKGSDQ